MNLRVRTGSERDRISGIPYVFNFLLIIIIPAPQGLRALLVLGRSRVYLTKHFMFYLLALCRLGKESLRNN